MLSRKTFFALAALIPAVADCSKGYTGPEEGIPPASFALKTINGQPVPLTAAIRGAVRVEILSATFKIESTFKFTNSTTYRRTENGQVSTSVEDCVGTYFVTNTTAGTATIIFRELGGENTLCGVQLSPVGIGGHDREYTGTWDGANTLTVDFDQTTHSVYGK
jgi:hypothetical protein